MSADEVRSFLQRHIEKNAGPTMFAWESEELDDAVDILVDAIADVIEANNRRLAEDLARNIAKDMQM